MNRDEILGKLESFDLAGVISNGLKSPVSVRSAEIEKNKYGKDSVITYPFHADGSPRKTEAEFDALSDAEKARQIEFGFNYKPSKSLEDSVKGLASNPEDILRNGDVYAPELTKIAQYKPIRENADADDSELLNAVQPYSSYVRLVDDLEAGRPIEPENKAQLEKIAAAAASKRQYDALEGYTRELRELGAKYAELVPGEITNDDLKNGAKHVRDEAKSDLENRYGADFEVKVAEAVGKTITKMARSSNNDQENAAVNLTYKAFKGYQPGERDFKTVYP